MVSVAHEFMYNGGQWKPTKFWAVDVVKYTSTDTWNTVNSAVYPPHGGCYWVTLPGGWRDGTSPDTAEYDFAVVEAATWLSWCSGMGNPGDFTGWVPAGIGTDADVVNSYTIMEGYDAAPDWDVPVETEPKPLPDATQEPGRIYAVGSMLTRFNNPGAAWVSSSNPLVILHQIDSTGGSSGAGFLKNLFLSVGDSTYYWTGIHSNAANQYLTTPIPFNSGRRLDYGLLYFIASATTEW